MIKISWLHFSQQWYVQTCTDINQTNPPIIFRVWNLNKIPVLPIQEKVTIFFPPHIPRLPQRGPAAMLWQATQWHKRGGQLLMLCHYDGYYWWGDPVLVSSQVTTWRRELLRARTAISYCGTVIEPTSHQEHQGNQQKQIHRVILISYLMSGPVMKCSREIRVKMQSLQYNWWRYRYDTRWECESVWGSVTALYCISIFVTRDVTWQKRVEDV